MKLFELYKKNNGKELVRYYHHYGLLGSAFFWGGLLHGSKIEQEQFREIMSYKIQKKFHKKYFRRNVAIDGPMIGNDNTALFGEKIIWVAWFQGMESAPELVKLNYNRLINNTNETVILITKDNIENYVKLPQIIFNKWYAGAIPNTHFSDIVRAQLLTVYGGVWLDSTVVMLGRLPSYFSDEFFMYQSLKPGKNALVLPFSNWALASKANNVLIKRTRDLLLQYWIDNDKPHEYFIFHRMMKIVMAEYPEKASRITPIDNSQPHAVLVSSKNMELTEKEIANMFDFSPIHKLSYKVETPFQKENNKKIFNWLSNHK
ncbi:capsular polysaccharide synthesis protein [Leuconostoc pseudomesenteroides]|uniref:capsular polysaccharide synthesis protein n=1 Tax=Leuconostoc pseudomesenteroides TaxID=33968 RepID=UPI0039E7521C